MREIKFKAFIKTKNKTFEVISIDFKYKIVEVRISEKETDTFHFEDTELMQYIGIKDKNGVEIYEGDIVEWIDGGERPFIYEIIYDDCGYYAKSSNNEKISIGGTMHSDMNINIEVIGNIYENKELLNE